MNRYAIQSDVDLTALNTFGLAANARHFLPIEYPEQLQALLRSRPQGPFRILGGGSNVLITRDIEDELLLWNGIKGRTVLNESEREAVIEIGGGENWHSTVQWCLDQGFGGLENLSLIPGTVGAAPIQNIGAYGVELNNILEEVEVLHLQTNKLSWMAADDCAFGYRDSIFKHELKGKVFITRVRLKAHKDIHRVATSYGAIRQELNAMGVTKRPTISTVSQAVIRIRQSKLPDPRLLGNAGSFFKNPQVPDTFARALSREFSDMPCYPLPDGQTKIPAAWLIEQCGWKGKRIGQTGAHKQQALVLVNYGGASGREVLALSKKIMASVSEKFGISLEREINVW